MNGNWWVGRVYRVVTTDGQILYEDGEQACARGAKVAAIAYAKRAVVSLRETLIVKRYIGDGEWERVQEVKI